MKFPAEFQIHENLIGIYQMMTNPVATCFSIVSIEQYEKSWYNFIMIQIRSVIKILAN